MVSQKIVIDTDPGQDDALAILLALASPEELDVLGIICVAGNVPLSSTVHNARLICELAGRHDVAIFAGCDRPMVRPLVTAEEVHGESGLDGYDWPAPTMPVQTQHGVDWLVETLMAAQDGEITLCVLGPATNIGMALAREPRIAPKVDRIITMGGGFSFGGNITPAAEFNVFVDPHAADRMYRSGIPIVAMPLDVTQKALMPPEWIKIIADLDGEVGKAIAGMLGFFQSFDQERYDEPGGPLHDPATVAYLLQPELYGGKAVHVQIETSSELTMGMTVVDYWHRYKREPNCIWVDEVNADGFYDLLTQRLARLPVKS